MNLAVYSLLFTAVGVGFIFVHLVLGKLIRPNRPGAEKKTTYECGEPTIGSAWIQFDLRFYVVALLFVIFDVEVAFFFPWAEVFGRANDVAALEKPQATDVAGYKDVASTILAASPRYGGSPAVRDDYTTTANADPGQYDRTKLANLQSARTVVLNGIHTLQRIANRAQILQGQVTAKTAGAEALAEWADLEPLLDRTASEEKTLLALQDTLNDPGAAPDALHAAPSALTEADLAALNKHDLGFDPAAPRLACESLASLDPAEFDRLKTYENGREAVEQKLDNEKAAAGALAWSAFFDILVFFGVLLVGFAYLWRRGDLAWVRSIAAERAPPGLPSPAPAPVKPAPEVLTASSGAH